MEEWPAPSLPFVRHASLCLGHSAACTFKVPEVGHALCDIGKGRKDPCIEESQEWGADALVPLVCGEEGTQARLGNQPPTPTDFGPGLWLLQSTVGFLPHCPVRIALPEGVAPTPLCLFSSLEPAWSSRKCEYSPQVLQHPHPQGLECSSKSSTPEWHSALFNVHFIKTQAVPFHMQENQQQIRKSTTTYSIFNSSTFPGIIF